MLDMDGVLVNFNKAACAIIDAPYPPTKYWWWNDIPNGKQQVDAACTTDFWFNLEWMHDGLEIFKIVFEKFTNDIYLLTTPMPNLESATGKAMWVDKYIPVFNKRLIITRAPKHLLAKPGTLLIDDSDKNIEEFRAAGGQGILVSRPWNKLHKQADKSLEVVKKELEKL